jgi:ribokinase
MPLKALTLGSAVIDIIVTIAPERIEHMQMRNADTSFLLVEEGRKVDAESVTRHIGGGGVNTAVSLARLGFDTAALVKMGVDRNAEDVTQRLKAESVSCEFLVTDEKLATGSSVLLSSHERNAGIFTARGANTALLPGDLPDEAFKRDLVFISGLSNESADCFPHVVAKASAAGARVATNPGIRQLSSRADEFFACLDRISILTLNRVESEQLVPRLIATGVADQRTVLKPAGKPDALIDRGLFAGGFQLPFDSYVRAMTSLGVEKLLVTNGADGAYAGTKDAIWHCTVPKVEVAGTAGAGDAFASTFAGLITAGASVEDAIKSATCNAGSVVSHLDTQTGLLPRDKLAARVASFADELVVSHWEIV